MICHGTSSDIIGSAISLGLLCRPCGCARVGVGEALEVSRDMFWRVDHDGHTEVFSPSPDELTHTWELTTQDLIRQEWHKSCETF